MSVEATPQWDVADRMRKSLREAGIGVSEMADYLEVRRNTVSNWINGRTRPPGTALRLWAMRCGVPYGWLTAGLTGAPDPTPGSGGTNHRYVPLPGLRKAPRKSPFASVVTLTTRLVDAA